MGDTVILDGSGSFDPDGDPISYQWTLTLAPEGSTATLAETTIATPAFVPDQEGSYVFQLVVSDGTAQSPPATVTITATAVPPENQPPTVNLQASPSAGPAPLSTTLTANATDPEGDPLTYDWTFGDGSTATGEAMQTHSYRVARTYVATVTVTDGQHTVTESIPVSVTPSPDLKTRVVGRTIDRGRNPVAGARIQCLASATTSTADGTFAATNVPTTRGAIQCTAVLVTANGITLRGASRSVSPLPGGETNVGDIILRERTEIRYPGLRLPTHDPYTLTTADFNADGAIDIAVANRGFSVSGVLHNYGVSVFLGRGDGSFQPEQRFETGREGIYGQVFGIAAADVTGDGKLDLIASRTGLGGVDTVVVLPGNGDGTFQAPVRSNAHGAGPLSVGDLNRDARPDLLVAFTDGLYTGGPAMVLGNGNGTFRLPPIEDLIASGFMNCLGSAFVAVDVNSDGIADIIRGGSDLSVCLNNGNATFRAPQLVVPENRSIALSVGDLSGDNIPDIAGAHTSPEQVSVAVGLGNGRFQPARFFLAGPRPSSLVMGDVNRDGTLDLVVGNEITLSEYSDITGNTDYISVLRGNGNGTLHPPQRFTVGDGPHAVVLADFDADGTADVATANTVSDDVSILFGRGDGTFPTQQRFAVGNFPVEIAVADLNGDDIPDAVTTNAISSDVSVSFGKSDGTFLPSQQLLPGSPIHGVTLVDVTGDGTIDLIGAHSDATVSVRRGNGNGTFQEPVRFAVGNFSDFVAVADINADGHSDLVTANGVSSDGNDVSILLGHGDGTFEERLPVEVGGGYFGEGGGPQWVAVEDLNGDHNADLAVVTSSSDKVSILLGKGDGSFHTPQRYLAGDGPRSVTVSDMNADGHADLVTANGISADVSVLLGNGDGTFAAPHRYEASSGPAYAADLNFDGFPDLAVVDSSSHGLVILWNKGDGTFTTPVSYAASGNPETLALTDLNRDGLLDVVTVNTHSNDLSVLLATVRVSATPVDRAPPPAPDLGKITVSDPSNGKVRVSGTAGSVEAGGRVVVTNMATGAQATGIANADGSFSVEIVAGEGQSLSLVVTDAAGNASPTRTTQVGVAVRISITEPAEGTRTQHQRALVRGTVHGPLNTGVIVNGVVAAVYNGEFVAEDVSLRDLGVNDYEIAATATTLGGQTVGTSVTVHTWGNPEVLEVDASVTSGVAPLDVTFSYTFGSTIPLQTLRLDADGNGTFEVTTTDPTEPLHYTYSTPGIYTARLQATDQQGGTFTAQVPIVVQDVTTLDTMFRSMWRNMNTALVAGDTTTALTFLDSAAQKKYGPVWQVLLPHMAEIVASYSPVRGVGIGQNVAEYGVNRTIDGENRLFLIYFLKDKDGVWRLAAM